MGQTFTEDTFAGSHVGQTDLTNMEANFLTLRSNFSGSSSPSLPSIGDAPGITWFDTGDNSFKIRNAANTAWRGVMCGNNTTPIWMYVNSAPSGWVASGSLTDRVIALKGGTYGSGGTTYGTWTQPNCTLTTSQIPSLTAASDSHNHGIGISNNEGNANPHIGIESFGKTAGGGNQIFHANRSYYTTGTLVDDDAHTHQVNVGGGSSHNHGSTYRPSAAVGMLVYPVYT